MITNNAFETFGNYFRQSLPSADSGAYISPIETAIVNTGTPDTIAANKALYAPDNIGTAFKFAAITIVAILFFKKFRSR